MHDKQNLYNYSPHDLKKVTSQILYKVNTCEFKFIVFNRDHDCVIVEA